MKREDSTYESPPFSEVFGGTATRCPRVDLDVYICFGLNVLNLVDP